MTTLYQYVKLGMHLEFLRGIASVSIIPATSLVAWPALMNNQASTRYSVMKVVESMKAVQIQLEVLGLTQTAQQSATRWGPMLSQMEAALAQSPQPSSVVLRDEFASQLIEQTMIIVQSLKEETASTEIALK